MKQLPSLNGLRAISIVIVLLDHLLRLNLRVPPTIHLIPLFDGHFGVNVFFVISGFLITTLLLNEQQATGTISIKDFYIRRVLRIFPAYYFLLIVYAYLQWLGLLNIAPIFWIMALTYTRYILILGDIYTAHAWSLSVEENFYFLWPAVMKYGNQRRKNIALCFILIVPLFRMGLYMHPVSWIGEDSIFVRIDAIAMGCYVALYREKLIVWLAPYWNKLFYGALLFLFLPAALNWYARTYTQTGLVGSFGAINGTIINILLASIMLYSVYGPKNLWFRMLNSKPFNYIGILSYSIYLWQQLFMIRQPWWVTRFPQNLFCIFFAAFCSYEFIEKPFLRLKSKFSSKRKTPITVLS